MPTSFHYHVQLGPHLVLVACEDHQRHLEECQPEHFNLLVALATLHQQEPQEKWTSALSRLTAALTQLMCCTFMGVNNSCPPKLIRAFQSTCCSSTTTTTRGSTTKAATTVRKASVEVLSIYGVTTDQHSVQQLPLPFKAFWPPMDPNGSLPLLPIMPLWFSTASGSIHLLFTSWNLEMWVYVNISELIQRRIPYDVYQPLLYPFCNED